MTLFKQIGAVTTLFLLIVLSTIMVLNFHSSEKFVQNQLHANAEDTAASLALALGGVVSDKQESLVAMKTMISAIFDRGYYEAITLYDPQEKILAQEKISLQVKDVPLWFIKLVSFSPPLSRSDISKGWEAFGTLEVKSHVGHAYKQLWDIFNELIQTFILLAFIFLVLLSVLIKIILKPLQSIEKQAKAIQNHDFLIHEKIPFTTEFRHVVSAMNSMVVKVKEIFDKEAQSLKKYHEVLYTDAQTALYNRKYLSLKLASFLEAQSQISQGSFILFSFDDLSKAKERLGYKKYETFLADFAQHLRSIGSDSDDTIIARMNDNDFAILIPSADISSIQESLLKFMESVAQFFAQYQLKDFLILSAGAVNYTPEETQKNLFAKADFLLAKAKMKEGCSIEFSLELEDQKLFFGKEEWIAMLNTSLEENMLKLASQSVVLLSNEKSEFHQEVYLRMLDKEGTLHSAGYFLPMLINLKLTDEVDKHVISLAMHHARRSASHQNIAININADFLKNPSNFEWLKEKLESFSKEQDMQLSFEATKFSVLKNIELFTQLAKLLEAYGAKFGIDNFSIGSEDLHFLQVIKPHYLKANKSFFLDLQDDKNSSANDSLSILAGSIGIKLIATNVETAVDIEKLEKIGIIYLQGSYIATPQLIGA